MDHRIMGNILYLNEKQNIICWKKSHFVRMADELDIYRPTVLEGNPSLLAKLAFWALDNGRKLYRPDVITFTYELPSVIHMAAILLCIALTVPARRIWKPAGARS